MVEVEGDTGSGERRHRVERRISTGGVGFVGGGFLATGRRRGWGGGGPLAVGGATGAASTVGG
jgi:hypothetical protein